MTWTVEKLTKERIRQFVQLCREFYDKAGHTDHLPFCYDHVIDLAIDCIHSPYWYGAVCIELNVVVGAFVGRVFKPPYTSVLIGDEIGIYVSPDEPFRAAKAGELLRGFIGFCKEHNVADIHAGAMAQMDNLAIDAFYKRNGFQPLGMMYSLKDLSMVKQEDKTDV